MDKDKQIKVENWIKSQSEAVEEIDLSVVVPAYNEQWRLPTTLIDMIDYFDEKLIKYELIVVDDGSTDETGQMVRKFERIRPQVNLIRIPNNHGKGYAVKTGVLNSHGRLVLFADADGSTPMSELARLTAAIERGADVAFGSRAMRSEDTRVTTSVHRRYFGRIFNFFVNSIVLPGVADTQCGFKLFRAPAAKFLFSHQTAERYSFDVEILLIARKVGFQISEVPINWNNVPGSKVNLLVDSLKMFLDILIFRFRHRHLNPESLRIDSSSAVKPI